MLPPLDLQPEWIIDEAGRPDPYGIRQALASRKAARPDRQRAARMGKR